LVVAAATAIVSLGGFAAAGGFNDGVGVDGPASLKIPYVQERIEQIQEDLAALDTSTPEGKAYRAALEDRLAAVHEVLERLCDEAGQPDGC
jgi:hypothetical protein